MGDILFRLPTKANKFGYVELTLTPTDVGADNMRDVDPEILGRVYDEYVRAFQKGETAASVAAANAAVVADVFPGGGPQAPTEAVSEDAAVDAIVSGLGATVVGTEEAPWNKPQPQGESKPWENSGPPAAVADIDWS